GEHISQEVQLALQNLLTSFPRSFPEPLSKNAVSGAGVSLTSGPTLSTELVPGCQGYTEKPSGVGDRTHYHHHLPTEPPDITKLNKYSKCFDFLTQVFPPSCWPCSSS
ncbi:mCG1026341, partial [Mus musculus]